LSAEGDVLLTASSPQDLAASREALKKAGSRLAFKRRFGSPDFVLYHFDMQTALLFDEETASKNKKKDLDMGKALAEYFKTPLNIEVDFSFKPGTVLVSSATNLFEALADAKWLESLEPPTNGGFFPAGGGKLFFGGAGLCFFRAEDFKKYPGLDNVWNQVVVQLGKVGLAESDIEDLLAGSVTLAWGSVAAFQGLDIPGGYVALTGQKGAASKILKALIEDDRSSAVPLSPVKAEGWSSLFQADPAVVPVPVLVGVKGETLFAGVADPKALNQNPEIPSAAKELFGKDFFSVGFMDTKGIWEYLRNAVSGSASPLNSLFAMTSEGKKLARLLLEADFPLKSVRLWVPALETSFTEFAVAEVPPERNFLFKISEIWEERTAAGSGESSFGDSPLGRLLGAKAEIEETLAEDGTALDDLDFDDVAFVETPDGRLFVGTRVTGAEKKSLLESARPFGLKGSAGLNIAPGDADYAGQEAVWIEIDRPEP
jgi:hypothetical protein